MRRSNRMICRSENIRYIRPIYGAPYDLKALQINGLRQVYTEYTVFSDTHTYIETIKKYFHARVFARVRAYLTPYIPYIPYMAYREAL